MNTRPPFTAPPPSPQDTIAREFMTEIRRLFGPRYSGCLFRWLTAGEADRPRRIAERDAAIEILVDAGMSRRQSATIVRSHTAFAQAAADARTAKPTRVTAATLLGVRRGPGGDGIA